MIEFLTVRSTGKASVAKPLVDAKFNLMRLLFNEIIEMTGVERGDLARAFTRIFETNAASHLNPFNANKREIEVTLAIREQHPVADYRGYKVP
jgi:hypothetical protein